MGFAFADRAGLTTEWSISYFLSSQLQLVLPLKRSLHRLQLRLSTLGGFKLTPTFRWKEKNSSLRLMVRAMFLTGKELNRLVSLLPGWYSALLWPLILPDSPCHLGLEQLFFADRHRPNPCGLTVDSLTGPVRKEKIPQSSLRTKHQMLMQSWCL